MTFQEQGIDRVFCDTSFFYACLDNQDVHHGRARTLVEDAATAHVVLYSTWDNTVSKRSGNVRWKKRDAGVVPSPARQSKLCSTVHTLYRRFGKPR